MRPESAVRSDLVLGAHLSLKGKPEAAVRWAGENGFQGIQIFASNPSAWKPPSWTTAGAAEFRRLLRDHGVEHLYIHAIYLVNLASSDPVLAERSRTSLIATLQAGSLLGSRGVVTHLGSHKGQGFDRVADQIAGLLLNILGESGSDVPLLLENSAGPGSILGAELAELAALLDLCGRPQALGVVLDTAHLCATGWDFQNEQEVERLVNEIDNRIGWDCLAAIHANDSASPLGSRRDRHANIGEGHIGDGGFRNLLRSDLLRARPWVLETPDLDKRAVDGATLRALAPVQTQAEAGAA